MAKTSLRRESASLRDRSLHITSTPGELPLIIENRASISGLIFLPISAFVCFFAAVMIIRTDFGLQGGDYDMLMRLAPTLTALMGLVFLFRALRAYLRKGHVEITRDSVSVVEPGISGKESLTEPLSAFEGVRWRQYRINNSSDSGGNHSFRHVVDLAHPDGRIFVPLLMWTTSGQGPRKEWEDLAKLIGLPAIDARETDDVRVRASEDVDKSIRDLASEGKVSREWDDRPPPEKITIRYINDGADPDTQQLRLEMYEDPIPEKIAYPLAAILGAAGVYAVIVGPRMTGLICFALACVTIWVTRRSGKVPAELTLTRKRLTYAQNGVTQVDLPLKDIELVRAGTGGVLVETDQGDKRIAGNLPQDALEYVRDIVESALANA